MAVHPESGEVVGFQVADPYAEYTAAFDHVGAIGTYIDLSRHRQGIASVLYPVTFAAAKRIGFEKLFSMVRADNPGALSTYRRHGFTVVGTARNQAKINGRYIDEIIIEKWL